MTELITPETVEELCRAAERARHDASYLSALSGAGPIAELEAAFRERLGVSYALCVSSGTAALHTALVACGVKPGDEVVVPAYSWPQTISPIVHMGAIPVVVDVEIESFNIRPIEVCKAISNCTKALIAVHMFGRPARLDELATLCKKKGVSLIEDAAHAFGAAFHGRPVGAWGDAACFSLGRSKPVTAGEGGVLVTKLTEVFDRAVAFSQHPIRQAWDMASPSPKGLFGMNYRIHPLGAVIAKSQLLHAEDARRKRAEWARKFLYCLDGIAPFSSFKEDIAIQNAFYRLPLIIDRNDSVSERDRVLDIMRSVNLAAGIGPISEPLNQALQQSGFKFRSLACPNAESLCKDRAVVCEITHEINPVSAGSALGKLLVERTLNTCY